MKISTCLFIVLCLMNCTNFSMAQWQSQWEYAVTDTLTYHNHSNGKLKIHRPTNQLYSLQRQFTGNQFRIDRKVNENWENVISGNDGIDCELSDDSIFVLKKTANQFQLETYDLNGVLYTTYPCGIVTLSANYVEAQLKRTAGDTLFVRFVDPNYPSGGSVLLFENGTWQDLVAENFSDLELTSQGIPVGLAVQYSGPAVPPVTYTIKELDFATGNWNQQGLITVVDECYGYGVHDMTIATNDSIYLMSITHYPPGMGAFGPNGRLFAVSDGNVSIKTPLIGMSLEEITTVSIVENKRKQLLITYSTQELGPWGIVAQVRWNRVTNSWIPNSPIWNNVSNNVSSEFTQVNPKVKDVIVDSLNKCYVDYTFETSSIWTPQTPYDSTHTHVHMLADCNYLNEINNVALHSDSLLSMAGPYVSYQWQDCITQLNISGMNDPVFVDPEPGEYAVVISYDGCTDTSDCVLIEDNIGLSENQPAIVKSWPNPAQGYFYIESTEPILTVKLYSVRGELLEMKTPNKAITELNASGLEKGIYMLEIQTISGKSGFKKVMLE